MFKMGIPPIPKCDYKESDSPNLYVIIKAYERFLNDFEKYLKGLKPSTTPKFLLGFLRIDVYFGELKKHDVSAVTGTFPLGEGGGCLFFTL